MNYARTMLELHPPDEVLVVSSKPGCARPLAVANLDAALDRYPRVHLERNMFDDTEVNEWLDLQLSCDNSIARS